MKRSRIIILVAFMFTMSSLFAYNFVQGEEITIVNQIEADTINVELNKIKLQTKLKEADYIASIRHQSAIRENKILESEFDDAKKVEEYFNQKAIELELSIDTKSQLIVDLTPLDYETATIVMKYANEYNFEPSFILGMMDLESNFNQYLVGGSQDRGYMQIIPGTEKWLATDYGEELGLVYNPANIFDAEYNIALSVKYLDVLRQEFGLNYTKMLTAYNRGTGGMHKWYREHGTYETAYSRVILKRAQKYISVN